MKNKNSTLLILTVLLFSIPAYAQVGINNTSPKATLDIAAKTTDGTAPEGLIAPRLTGDQIKAADAQYTAAQAGTIIYVTAAVTAGSPKTVNLTTPGYYVFDGTVWTSFNGSQQNIYNTDGTLNGNRTVSQVANNLAFTSTATTGTSHFTIDGTTLNVDAVNNRVGIGTSTPAAKLDVAGTILNNGGGTVNKQGTQLAWNDANLGGAGLGYSGILNHRGSGAGGFVFSGTADNAAFTEYMRITGDGKVGIGTASPNAYAKVDMNDTNQGIMIPRLALSSAVMDLNADGDNNISNQPAGLMVYNTATAGAVPNDVVPGYYYWDGSKWKGFIDNYRVQGTGVIATWTGSNTGNDNTGVLSSPADGVSFISSLRGSVGGSNVPTYRDYMSVSSGSHIVSTACIETSELGWAYKGKTALSAGTTWTDITQPSWNTISRGKRETIVQDYATGSTYRLTLLIDTTYNLATYILEKVK
ncbi:hypothetical protein NK356_23235 [Chryseobacterium sp. S0630]|uniref:hypothetical protein n=1 Tax=Chryseobacterium sp. S0630 TaxID=2957803 RepID=UPI0020A1E908|nr:hypothetical protein [Chryseobacterium sp. S0630]MCP1302092.1 hypothetical protein [Chryseobacterium sp. S0630]